MSARRWLFACACALSLLLIADPASAYAWMIRHGYGGCTTCHADPSGGELLTRYGRVQGDLILRMRFGSDSVSAQSSTAGEGETESYDELDEFDDDDEPAQKQTPEPAPADTTEGPSAAAGFLWGLIDPPEGLLLGGSYRHMTLYKDGELAFFPMQADLYAQLALGRVRVAGSVGLARVPAGSPHARAAQVTTAQGDQYNMISRTHWIGYDLGAAEELTLRAGRINLPFGVRIPEHTMWVREATRTDRESDQQHGVALAYNGSLFRGELMAIAGNYQINPDKYRERGYSAFVETLVTEPFATGVSSLLTRADADRDTLEAETTVRGAHGVFTRITVAEPLAFFLEADAIHQSRKELGYVGFIQADYEPVQGLHLIASGEVLDNGYRQSEDFATGLDIEREPGFGEPRLGAWLGLDWFFLPHLEARFDAVMRQQDPFTILAQLHAYL